MNATTTTADPARRRSNATYRWIRQLHLWIGAWGALAAIIYGFSGLVMNNRFGDSAWPQGDSAETGRIELQIPAEARTSPEELSLWLRETQNLDAQVIRKGAPGGKEGKEGKARDAKQAPKWSLSGGTASASWSLEYSPGKDTAELKRSSHTLLAAINRLHKGVGGGWAWTLLADSFAIGMLLLGLSGIWMWARGRTPREMVLSVFGLSLAILAAVVVPALL
ncbi:PepSY-associated TM helix domain-containing protein [Lysobacter solisilvae (ex Woo and Kim 2020)]|uniref:PepSY-associated TM helix domain-containing protein n=1 Tax=Agrilutibacter terrestris TaxID=2865112 RepID=A0A7H0FYN2_9GAMM|nr:PepSY-associated TM helix domain-containing protein [Lysobacter terrestris]QNP41148.1 PepSY-associated TM helix domain-containing protein [Lysobacter terrestris]